MKTAGVVYGTFTDVDGRARPGVSITLGIIGESWGDRVTTDSAGQFRFEQVPGGRGRFSVDCRNCLIPAFDLKAGEEKQVDIDLSTGERFAER